MSMPTEGYSNPVRLSVATSDAGPSDYTERERLLKAKKRNDEVRKKADQWADKLMEETVDRDTFKKALRYIHASAYEQINHERHLNSLCSYPLCSNPPAEAYNPNRRFRISTTNRTITQVEGNKEEGFCGRQCRIRNDWVKTKLGEAGSVLSRSRSWQVELVEDLELSSIPTPLPQPTTPTRTPQSPVTKPAAAEEAIPLPNLMADLQIHERPTRPPHQAPTSPVHAKQLASSPSASSGPKGKRGPTSILGDQQSKLAQVVMKASKAINPEPQVNPDSESEGEHDEVEWEREVGLEWEGGEEEMWEAMRSAKELVRED